ncbi:MAG TPA: glycosyl hydrolase 53 family protein [bacterium]|nr:glycosyl hydrolase 53 family protein [bacterium]
MIIKLLLFFLIFKSIIFSDNLIKGIDASYVDELLEKGAVFKENNEEKNIFDIYKNNGINYIRLRLWHSPKNNYCNLEHTIKIAKIIKSKNLKLLLAIHYSDDWADPSKQTIPALWQNKSFNDIEFEVFNYTQEIINSFKENNILPDIIQIGNEIENGFLWDYGRINNFTNFMNLLKQAIFAIHNNLTQEQLKKVKILIHISCSTNYNKTIWFYENLINENVPFDLIGLSYYPWWHGTLEQLENSLKIISKKINKEIIIVETAYPWTLDWFDNKHNIIGETTQLLNNYPASPAGQLKFIEQLFKIIKNISNVKGLFYFSADAISCNSFSSDWENLTLFDFYGNALPTLKIFLKN